MSPAGEQERKKKAPPPDEDAQAEATATKTTSTDEVDELLDEIDEVLETNAEEFVRSYVQKGGEAMVPLALSGGRGSTVAAVFVAALWLAREWRVRLAGR
jgi:prokaryotic ubiquitin-like protein Pup